MYKYKHTVVLIMLLHFTDFTLITANKHSAVLCAIHLKKSNPYEIRPLSL